MGTTGNKSAIPIEGWAGAAHEANDWGKQSGVEGRCAHTVIMSHRWRIIAEPLTVSLRWRQMSCEIQYLEFALQNCTCKKQNINRSEQTRERSETQVTLGHQVSAGAGRSAHLAEG